MLHQDTFVASAYTLTQQQRLCYTLVCVAVLGESISVQRAGSKQRAQRQQRHIVQL